MIFHDDAETENGGIATDFDMSQAEAVVYGRVGEKEFDETAASYDEGRLQALVVDMQPEHEITASAIFVKNIQWGPYNHHAIWSFYAIRQRFQVRLDSLPVNSGIRILLEFSASVTIKTPDISRSDMIYGHSNPPNHDDTPPDYLTPKFDVFIDGGEVTPSSIHAGAYKARPNDQPSARRVVVVIKRMFVTDFFNTNGKVLECDILLQTNLPFTLIQRNRSYDVVTYSATAIGRSSFTLLF